MLNRVSPTRLRLEDRAGLSRLWAAVITAVGLTAAVWGLVVGAVDVPPAGVISESPGGVVLEVVPGGVVWRNGVRIGDQVVSLEPGDTAEDWRITTLRGGVEYTSGVAGRVHILRELIPLAVVFVVVAGASLVVWRRNPTASSGLAVVGGSLGTYPAVESGDPIPVIAGAIASLALPGSWLVTVLPPRPKRILLATAAVAGLGWLLARLALPEYFDVADAIRIAVSLGMVLIAGTLLARWMAVGRLVDRLGVPRAIDLGTLGLAAGLAIGLSLATDLPFPVLIGLVIVGVLAYPRWRRLMAYLLDRLFVVEARESASIAAVEGERERLARHIHDAPLQELSGAIRRLELIPGAGGEASRLRDVAQHLRDVATELRPPVLDDLGLGPALASLAEQPPSEPSSLPVRLAVDDQIGYDMRRRLPAEVELAAYRVVQEAIGNAQLHSGGTEIVLDGFIRQGQFELTVTDNGAGLSNAVIYEAQRRGHLGVSTMRQRAAAIGATLEIGRGASGGSSVRIHWTGS